MVSGGAKKWVIFLSITSLIIVLIVVGWNVVKPRLADLIQEEIKEALSPAFSVEIASCEVDLFARSISITELKGVANTADTISSEQFFSIDALLVKGISPFSLISERNIRVQEVSLENITVRMDHALLNDSSLWKQNVEKDRSMQKTVIIDQFDVEGLDIIISADTVEEFSGKIDFVLSGVSVPLEKVSDTNFKIEGFNVENFRLAEKDEFYTTSVRNIEFNHDNVTIDSILLTPRFSKFEFGRRAGKEVDRIESFIPSLTLNAVHLNTRDDTVFRASGVHIYSPVLNVFRDKRLPFIKDHEVLLPVDLIKTFTMDIQIDTVRLYDGDIRYEEFPEEGDSSGYLRFAEIHASIYHLYNRNADPNYEHIDMDVEAKFMGDGLLKASFDLPFNNDKKYEVKGQLTNFNLSTLNPIIEPLGSMKVENGFLDEMDFSFVHDAQNSSGTIELKYNDLKLVSLTEKESKTAIDKFKTFVLNLLIPKEKTEDTTKSRRTGDIAFQRDPKRSIFNYWWKSLFTGVKSSYGFNTNNDSAK
jgi:hypothetical protein